MDVSTAAKRVLAGESLASLGAAYREGLLADLGLDPKTAPRTTFARETRLFLNRVCRELGDRHGDDQRALIALREWVRRADDYEAFDALLANFEFEGKEAVIQRGRLLFPRAMTSHWEP